jgi:hypothetical protein
MIVFSADGISSGDRDFVRGGVRPVVRIHFPRNALGQRTFVHVSQSADLFASSLSETAPLGAFHARIGVLGLIASALAPLISYTSLASVAGHGQAKWSHWVSGWHWAIMIAGGGAVTPLWFKVFNRLDASRCATKSSLNQRFDRTARSPRGRH